MRVVAKGLVARTAATAQIQFGNIYTDIPFYILKKNIAGYFKRTAFNNLNHCFWLLFLVVFHNI